MTTPPEPIDLSAFGWTPTYAADGSVLRWEHGSGALCGGPLLRGDQPGRCWACADPTKLPTFHGSLALAAAAALGYEIFELTEAGRRRPVWGWRPPGDTQIEAGYATAEAAALAALQHAHDRATRAAEPARETPAPATGPDNDPEARADHAAARAVETSGRLPSAASSANADKLGVTPGRDPGQHAGPGDGAGGAAIPDDVDPGIRRYVQILSEGGVETFESCQGGDGHAFTRPTVRFHGNGYEGFRALSIAMTHALPVLQLNQTYDVYEDRPHGPYWELVFREPDRSLAGETPAAGVLVPTKATAQTPGVEQPAGVEGEPVCRVCTTPLRTRAEHDEDCPKMYGWQVRGLVADERGFAETREDCERQAIEVAKGALREALARLEQSP